MYTTAINEKTSIETSTLLTCIQRVHQYGKLVMVLKTGSEKKLKKKVIPVSLVEPGLD